jgi:peptide deformylase
VAGRVRDVLLAPAHALAEPCPDVDATSDEVVTLAADLVATMRAAPGCVGLAANQIGVAAHVFALDVSAHPKARTHHGELVLVGARVVEASRSERAREGCLSVPDLTGDVKRASRLVVTGRLPGAGESVELRTDAFEARALLHELDHLDGRLFLDRVAGAHAVFPRRVYL